MTSAFEREFLFVSGKGGVGKTTVSLALGRHLAGNGRRVLVAFSGGLDLELVGMPEVGREVTLLEPGLSAVAIEPERAMHEYGTLMLKSETATAALFGNRYSRAFLSAIPGLYQWAVLGKAWFHANEEVDGCARFDHVIFDAPATGHGLEMLRVPKVISEASAPGILKRDAEAAWNMFTDERRAGVVVVTLPEELPVNESKELIAGLSELRLPLSCVVLNSQLSPIFSPAQAAELNSLDIAEVPQKGRPLLAAGQARAARESAERGQLERLREEIPFSLYRLPWLEDAGTWQGLKRLSEGLAEPLGAAP